jgi:RNA polymerase sigma factor (sigma-70 family)
VSDDDELLHAWRAGDAHAGSQLFERHVQLLVRFFRNKVDRGVEDLIQTTFLACMESQHRFEGRGEFRSFLLGIARHKLLQHYQAERTMREIDFGNESVADLAPGISTALGQRAEEELLLQALRSIPLDLQVLLELYCWESMTAREIAEALALPEGTVRSRIRSARKRVVEQMEKLAGGDEELVRTATDLDRWAESIRRRWRE